MLWVGLTPKVKVAGFAVGRVVLKGKTSIGVGEEGADGACHGVTALYGAHNAASLCGQQAYPWIGQHGIEGRSSAFEGSNV